MSDTTDLEDFILERLGTTLDEVYQRLIVCNFGMEEPELAMFTVALLDVIEEKAVGPPHINNVNAGFGESGTAERSRNRLMSQV